MTRAGDFLEATTYDQEIGGVTFTLRRRSAQLLMRALGSKYFGLITTAKNAGDVERVKRKVDEKAGREIAKRTCELFMVSPRCGDVTDADADVIGYEDLDASGFAALIVSLCLGGDMDFSASSEERTECATPSHSTPSEVCTEGALPATAE